MKNFISVLTPTYNRGPYLKKLYKSLLSQKIKNFEWIIADDGSTDQTEQIINSFIKKNKVKIIFIQSNIRIGKCVLDNILIKKANGKFVLMCDSDDFFKKDAFDFFLNKFNNFKDQFKNNIIGIVSQNLSTEGISQSYYPFNYPEENKIYHYKDLRKFIKGDATLLVKKNLYKNIKFPEIDFISNEGVVLEKLFSDKKFIASKKVTKIMNRKANLSVSFGDKLKYCKGSLYCIIKTNNKKIITI